MKGRRRKKIKGSGGDREGKLVQTIRNSTETEKKLVLRKEY